MARTEYSIGFSTSHELDGVQRERLFEVLGELGAQHFSLSLAEVTDQPCVNCGDETEEVEGTLVHVWPQYPDVTFTLRAHCLVSSVERLRGHSFSVDEMMETLVATRGG